MKHKYNSFNYDMFADFLIDNVVITQKLKPL